MMPSNGNIFRVTGPVCGEFTGHRRVNPPHKGQWRGALMFSLILAWTNGWVNNRDAGDLRRYRAHYDVTVMECIIIVHHSVSCHVALNIDWYTVYWTVCSGADQRKHQSSASLAFVRGIHRWPVNSPHKGPVTRKMFPFDDVIKCGHVYWLTHTCIVVWNQVVNILPLLLF